MTVITERPIILNGIIGAVTGRKYAVEQQVIYAHQNIHTGQFFTGSPEAEAIRTRGPVSVYDISRPQRIVLKTQIVPVNRR